MANAPVGDHGDDVKLIAIIKRAVSVGGAILLLVLLGCLAGVFEPFENDLYDLQARFWRKDKVMPEEVVLVLVDEASLSAMEPLAGRWPWQRGVFADLVEFLVVGGARKIVFDILFTESTASMAKTPAGGDRRLVEVTQRTPHVIHACQVVQDPPDEFNPNILKDKISRRYKKRFTVTSEPYRHAPEYTTIYWPFDSLARAVADLGVTSFTPDQDGVYRRAEMVFKSGNIILPALSLAAMFNGNSEIAAAFEGPQMILASPAFLHRIPLDSRRLFWVNPYGRFSAFSFSGVYLSLLRLQQGEVDDLPVHPDEFRDKVVFIGASAAGVEDLKSTSLGRLTPGVLLHASIYSNIITRDMLRQAPAWLNAGLALLAVMVTAVTIFHSRRMLAQISFTLLVLCAVALAVFFSFPLGWIIHGVPAFLGIAGTYLAAFTWISFSTGKEKRKIRNVLGQYVSPAILNSVLADHKEALLSAEVGQRRLLSMQFSDLRGFTAIAERHPVEQVVAFLNGYLAAMVDVIFQHQGTLDKFIGDAILAFWGAPILDPDHAHKAVVCALDMQRALRRLNERNRSVGLPELRSGVGIHTAEVILGNIGSQKKLDYTVIGDGVNLTSRIEALTKTYGCPILVSEQTYAAVRERICCRAVDKVQVSGKEQCTLIYEAIDTYRGATADTLQIAELCNAGFGFYRQKDFEKAAACYGRILKLNPADALSRLFVDRCNRYKQLPPPAGWNGECVLEHK
ncbi:MAG: CHASE2 domain-containing protein [Desulfobacteraceae bacterium]|nr:MAG: CHASE2 domain-containing protein [Desulfobacteraceae bacterium]